MTERQTIEEKADRAAEQIADVELDTDNKEPIRPELVDDVAYPDPNEPRPETAGTTLLMIIGGVFLVMIIVMVSAFIYFQDFWEGPTSAILPLLG
ncbi:hypothetical protein F8S13_16240 [Chloroflexia bacterium SDU3-3]|nr:hypothetical protein F8S13_16240 [Chloroflexia bacterium SDU3-3]